MKLRRRQVGRANFLVILSDDQRHDTMDYMPRTKARIFGEGVSLPNAYITTPLCCPSCASILTGMYAHKHTSASSRKDGDDVFYR